MRKMLILVALSIWLYANDLNALIIQATRTLDNFMVLPEEQIPPRLLSRAQAVVIVPNMIRGGFIAGARYGKGLLFVKTRDNWSDPLFIKMYGASLGWQIGLESIEVVLVFLQKVTALKILQNGALTLAADASLAVGPIGRASMVGAASRLKAQIYSYSRSSGIFVGIALAGTKLQIDFVSNQKFYGCDVHDLFYILEHKCNVHNQFLNILKYKLQRYTSWIT